MDNPATETTLKNQLKNRRSTCLAGLLILTLIILSQRDHPGRPDYAL